MRSIAVNGRYVTQLQTGVQRYAAEIVRRLDGNPALIVPQRPVSGMRGHLWEQAYLPLAARGKLLWSPCTTGPIACRRHVCTIHDLLPLEHPEWFSPRFAAWYSWLLPKLAKSVAHISTVSEFSRGRIVERLGVPEERVTIVPNGVDPRFSPRPASEVCAAIQALKWPRHYFLAMGVEPRKNTETLVEAWRRALGRMPGEIHLVMAGAEAPAAVHGEAAAELDLPPRARLAGFIDDTYLPAIYSGAVGFVFPSYYEGFGIPVLEAMACGAPVIASNRTAIPEVLGDAGISADPDDADAFAEAMLALAGSTGLRDGYRAKGLARARRFSWDASAAAIRELLSREAAA